MAEECLLVIGFYGNNYTFFAYLVRASQIKEIEPFGTITMTCLGPLVLYGARLWYPFLEKRLTVVD